jgi:hypothetical protein
LLQAASAATRAATAQRRLRLGAAEEDPERAVLDLAAGPRQPRAHAGVHARAGLARVCKPQSTFQNHGTGVEACLSERRFRDSPCVHASPSLQSAVETQSRVRARRFAVPAGTLLTTLTVARCCSRSMMLAALSEGNACCTQQRTVRTHRRAITSRLAITAQQPIAADACRMRCDSTIAQQTIPEQQCASRRQDDT